MSPAFPRITCTLGTTTDDDGVLARMLERGMGLARINTAYASLEEMAGRVDRLRAAGPVPVMLDLKGPQLRILCTTEKTDPATGQTVTRPCRYPIAQDELIYVGLGQGPVCFNHGGFAHQLLAGDLVTFDNGRIRARVADPLAEGVEPVEQAVLLAVLDPGGGQLTPQMGANVPGKHLDVPRLSPRDLQALEMGVARGVEWYALSFCRDARDVDHLHQELAARGDDRAGLVLKIEEQQGIDNLEHMVRAARDARRPAAVMIARGDLFVELPRARLPAVQADLLARCRRAAVPSMVATGLLLSMQIGPAPSRAEVCDVAAALLAGADSLMLSDETANGVDPARVVEELAGLIREYAPGGGP